MKPCYTNVTQLHLTSLKPVWSELEASLKPLGCKFNFGVNEPLYSLPHIHTPLPFFVFCIFYFCLIKPQIQQNQRTTVNYEKTILTSHISQKNVRNVVH